MLIVTLRGTLCNLEHCCERVAYLQDILPSSEQMQLKVKSSGSYGIRPKLMQCWRRRLLQTCELTSIEWTVDINTSLLHGLFACRIETYNQSTKPIVEHYLKLDKVRNIAADGSPEQVAIIVASFHWSLIVLFAYLFWLLTLVISQLLTVC